MRRFLFLLAMALTCAASADIGRAAETYALAHLKANRLDEKAKGALLVEEFNCRACHATEGAAASRRAPRLAGVASRVNPHYLERYLQSPHEVKPGATMPDVMGQLDAEERQRIARSIAHFLLSREKTPAFGLQAIDRVAAEMGRELFHEVGCAACHSPRDAQGVETMPASSVPLGALEGKYNVASLAGFLRAPHSARPSGRMPNMMLSAREAEQIANYLLEKTEVPGHLHYTLIKGRVWEGLEVNVTQEKSGHVDDFDLADVKGLSGNSALIYEGYLKIDAAGEYAFFLEMNGGELWLGGERIADMEPSPRRGVKTVEAKADLAAGLTKIKLVYIHAGKEPALRFEMAGPGLRRAAIPASRLSIHKEPVEPYRPYPVDAKLAEAGQRYFATLGCANCHDDVGVQGRPQTPLAELDPPRGCLSGETGAWPNFALSEKQRASLRAALPTIARVEPSQEDVVAMTLARFNCTACHEREGLGGVSPARNELFVGTKHELGNEGRIPPPLTHVGAKLQPSWIAEVMLRGKKQRKYLATRMPQFGEAHVGHLVELFEKVDKLGEGRLRQAEGRGGIQAGRTRTGRRHGFSLHRLPRLQRAAGGRAGGGRHHPQHPAAEEGLVLSVPARPGSLPAGHDHAGRLAGRARLPRRPAGWRHQEADRRRLALPARRRAGQEPDRPVAEVARAAGDR